MLADLCTTNYNLQDYYLSHLWCVDRLYPSTNTSLIVHITKPIITCARRILYYCTLGIFELGNWLSYPFIFALPTPFGWPLCPPFNQTRLGIRNACASWSCLWPLFLRYLDVSLPPIPIYSCVWLCACVCVCVRMCVCVLFSTACVSCFWLGAEPCPMIGFTAPPSLLVMSRHAQCRNEKAAALLVSVILSACADVFSFVGRSSLFLLFVSLEPCPPQIWWSIAWLLEKEKKLKTGTESLSPPPLLHVFRGNVFFRQQECFLWKRGWLLDCVVQQLCNTKIDFFLPRDLFYLLPSFLPVALVILIPQSFISSLRWYAVKSQASPSASIAPPSNVQNFVCSPLLSVCNGCSASPSRFWFIHLKLKWMKWWNKQGLIHVKMLWIGEFLASVKKKWNATTCDCERN